MKILEVDGETYHLPGALNQFQQEMYIHLINWKWKHLTRKPGIYAGNGYDAILPEDIAALGYPIYPPIYPRVLAHREKFYFKFHKYLGHMASSQAACINLLVPLLDNPRAGAEILSAVKPDLKAIATPYLDNGFRIEFWDEPYNLLNDHNRTSGTDSDFAIAYYDHQDQLNLWLIEHKLTEPEFTQCGGAISRGRTEAHACSPTSAVVDDPDLCYYQSARQYRYWELTLQNESPFNSSRLGDARVCPFMGGMNQLWRNQLLAFGMEQDERWPFKKVYFSVVYHPGNISLEPTLTAYQKLLIDSDRFFAFTLGDIVRRAEDIDAAELAEWLAWYRELYDLGSYRN